MSISNQRNGNVSKSSKTRCADLCSQREHVLRPWAVCRSAVEHLPGVVDG